MSELTIGPASSADDAIAQVSKRFNRRVTATPPESCPLTQQLAMLQTAAAQTCFKCVPCRDGIPQLIQLMSKIVDCHATDDDLDSLRDLAEFVREGSDCAIGYEAGQAVLDGLDQFSKEYESHITNHRCASDIQEGVPCESMCPAHVNVPAYIGLVAKGDTAGAVAMVRKDNPFPTACAYVCEHPCEARCRRTLIDAPLNIRGIKKYACDHSPANTVPVPAACAASGRKVAVIGAGPSGLTCAYFSALMGHTVDVFETHHKLGGMMRYGIPAFRFPREKLDEDIEAVTSAGDMHVHTGVTVDGEKLVQLSKDYDAVYIAIGAQLARPLNIPGNDAEGVFSAVELLHRMGDNDAPDFSGQDVVVIGGGNVAMDCCRTAVRLGAKSVSVAYRRRVEDMSALPSEVYAAITEGVEMVELQAPDHIEVDDEGKVAALYTRPQRIGTVSRGRPSPVDAKAPLNRIPADVVLIAVGQGADFGSFVQRGMQSARGRLQTDDHLRALVDASSKLTNVFVGGDCQSGPLTVIKAVGAGKVAARNIDEFLGYHHKLRLDVSTPPATPNWRTPCGRVEVPQRLSHVRARDWDCIEGGMSEEEVMQECKRCLRCDFYGPGAAVGGRRQYV